MGRLHQRHTGGSPKRTGESPRRRTREVLRVVIFFLLLYVFLWRIVEPHLLFHGGGTITDFPSFYTGWDFLRERLAYPGGPALYLSGFLAQMFCHSWLGALAIVLQALAMYLCMAHLLRRAGLSYLQFVGYAPAVLLAILYGRYTFYFPTTVAMLLALAFACGYIASIQRRRAPSNRLLAFTLLSPATYYIVGGAFLLFLSVCVVYELLTDTRWRSAISLTIIGAALPYLTGVLAFGVSPHDAYARLLPISWRVLQYPERSRLLAIACTLYLVPPAALLIGFVRQELRPGRHRRDSRVQWAIQTFVILGLGTAATLVGFDREEKTRLAVDHYASHRMWPEVLAEARRLPQNRFVVHAVNRALFHTGRLGDEMFRWPQDPMALFLLGAGRDWVHWQCFDAHLEMGLLNLAEHSLAESLEKLGDRPMILQRLATINMVKGNTGTAQVYLGMLRRTLFHSRWARRYLALLESDPGLSGDADIQHLRSMALEQDFPLLNVSKDQMLLSLLEKNGGNRMALEYLMAWHLLNGQLAGFVQHIDRFRDAGYAQLPRYFEEAALLYVHGTKQTLDAAGYAPRAQSQQQMVHIVGILDRYKGDKQAALAEMAQYHRDTYTFFYLYMRPGKAE